MTVSPVLLGVLAGVFVGLAVAGLVTTRRPLGMAGLVALVAAAVGTALGVPTWAESVSGRIYESFQLAAAAPMLARVMLLIAAAAWCAHVLGLLGSDRRVVAVPGVVAIVAGAVMVWQWWVLASDPNGGLGLDARWYGTAFVAGVAIPQLVVLIGVAPRRFRGTRWTTTFAVAAVIGLLWGVWRALEIFAPDAVGAMPSAIEGVLLAGAAIAYWRGSAVARTAPPLVSQLNEYDIDSDAATHDDSDGVEAPTEVLQAPASADDAESAGPLEPEPEPIAEPAHVITSAPEPEPEPTDTVDAQERVEAVAAALAGQLEQVGRGTAVAVGLAGDDVVFVTSDGLGYLPEGGAGAPGLVPLLLAVPDEFIGKWLGCAHPEMPLRAAAEQGHIHQLRAVATVGPGGNLDIDDLARIEPAELDMPRGRIDAVPVSEAHAVLAALRDSWSIELGADTAELAEKVAAARWTTWPDPEYLRLWVAELAARATDDLEHGDLDSAQYCLATARRVPVPTPAGTPRTVSPAAPAVARTSSTAAAVSAPSAPAAMAMPSAPASAHTAPVQLKPAERRSDSPKPPPKPVPVRPAPAPVTVERAEASAPSITDEEAASTASQILAGLSGQIPGTAEIAVAVAADGKAVFATSDGLGYLPAGAMASPRVVPLAAIIRAGFAVEWLGCDLPHKPLLAAIGLGLIPPAVALATTSHGVDEPGVTSVDLGQQVAARSATGLSTPRVAFGPVAVHDVERALGVLTDRLGPVEKDHEQALLEAEDLCWTDTRNPGYARAWARCLQAEAATAIAVDDFDSARYALANAVLALPAVAPAAES